MRAAFALAALLVAAPLAAQGADTTRKAPPPPLDGYNVVMRDSVLTFAEERIQRR